MSSLCIVLAGGLGTRLRGTISDLPKCLAPISGKPFLAWQLHSLAERGVDRFLLALGHGSDQVIESISQPWASQLVIDTVIERELLGTGGAARFAMRKVGLDEVLITNGDTFIGGSLHEMLEPLDIFGGESMRIATVGVTDRARFGGVVTEASNLVTNFIEKGCSGAGQINAGFYRVHQNAFEGELENVFSMETQVMPRLAAQRGLQSRELSGPFIDIGVPEDYFLFDANVSLYIR